MGAADVGQVFLSSTALLSIASAFALQFSRYADVGLVAIDVGKFLM